MKVSKNKVVLIAYTLTDKDGHTIDKSDEKKPLAYIQGIGNIIPGLEKEMEGKTKGDKFTVTVKPVDAYGERRKDLLHEVDKTVFDGEEELKVGMRVNVQTPNGDMIAEVIDVSEDKFSLDLNHPLAGLELTFDVKVLNVREASEIELDHGHVHEPGKAHL